VSTTTAVCPASSGIAGRLVPPGMLRSSTSTSARCARTIRAAVSTSPASATTVMPFLGLEHERQPRAHDRVVVGDHEPDLVHGAATLARGLGLEARR
jgi:hypothetical protein